MHRIRTVTFALALALAVAPVATPADLVVLFPFGNNNLLTAIDADTLTEVGALDAPSSAFKVQQSLDGSRYYVISQRSTSSVVTIDANTLERIASIDLGASPSDAAITPDGRYILVAAADVKVIDTATNTLRTSIPVEGAPTEIEIDETSRRAYVLTGARNKIAVIDLPTLSLIATLDSFNTASIALTLNGARLLAVTNSGVRQFRTRDLVQVDTVAGNFPLVNATITPIPDSPKIVVQSRGIAPANTAQLIDLNSGVARDIGSTGQNELSKVVILNKNRGYAIDADTMELLELDFTVTPNPSATPLPFGDNTRDISLSPNGRFLYATSLTNARLLKIDTETNEVVGSILTPIAPNGHNLVFSPSTLPPAQVTVNGGDNQFFPPNTTLPTPFSVRVVDSNGSPLPGVPVFFDDPAGVGVQIEPEQPSLTNNNGIATAILTLPPLDQLNPNAQNIVSLSGEDGPSGAVAPEDAIEPITITAAPPGINPAFFTVNIIRALGLIKVSGDNQVASENELFPLPMIFLATNNEGQPLPSGTEMNLAAFFASCDSLAIPLDPDGFATVRCRGRQFSPFSGQLFEGGSLSATIPTFQQELGIKLTTASFNFSVARGGTQLGIVKLSGDNQISQTGTVLPEPLSFRLTTNFGGPPKRIQVEIDQVSGPPMLIDPRRLQTLPTLNEKVKVTVGSNAGTAVIRVRSSTPGLPELFYTVTATGGQPSELIKSGDGQVGKISNPLPTPLRLIVINESGAPVPFPEVSWRVVSGDATLVTTTDSGGSNAAVTFGPTPGSIRVVAAIGPLQASFTLTSIPPEPASISTLSGQNQTITTGLLSDPLRVRVNEIDNTPAAGAVVTFSGPPSVRLHPTNGTPPGNPVQQATDGGGVAGVRVELLTVSNLGEEGAPTPSQLAQTVSVTASIGGQLATSFLLNVVGRTPALESAGVVNAATFEGGIVPGSIISIFGVGLMEGVVGVEFAGGRTSYNGTQVRIGGIPAPLLVLSSGPPEQINLQAPFELSPGQTTTIEVENNGSRSTITGVPVFLAQPGIFEISLQQGGRVGAVIHANNGRLVSPDNAAAHGEIVSLFATGVGRLSAPNGSTGVLGPIPPLVSALPTIVGVDNRGAPVLFSGYAPGFLGLYQVNFSIPIDARCGLRALNLRIGDSSSPATTIPIVCPQ